MSSPQSRAAVGLWPGFVLGWIRSARPNSPQHRAFEEYIAGIGMIQANQQRLLEGQPTWVYGTILNGIHESRSDSYPHITIAAATRLMRQRNEHIVLHSRVDAYNCYQGAKAHVDNIRRDDEPLRSSYRTPNPVRMSLVSEDSENENIRVGCTFDGGAKQWFFIDEQQNVVQIDSEFFRAGEGANEHMRFLHPVLNKTCRAVFSSHERPEPCSPDLEPTNLEAGMGGMTLSEEWVEVTVEFGKKMGTPLLFRAGNGKRKRTGWAEWDASVDDKDDFVFIYEGNSSGILYKSRQLPGAWVIPWWKETSEHPVQFRNAEGELFKTKAKRWTAGRNNSFYVYLEKGAFYLTLTLPQMT